MIFISTADLRRVAARRDQLEDTLLAHGDLLQDRRCGLLALLQQLRHRLHLLGREGQELRDDGQRTALAFGALRGRDGAARPLAQNPSCAPQTTPTSTPAPR